MSLRTHKITSQILPIVIILFIFAVPSMFAAVAKTILGKIAAIVLILYYTNIDVLYGALACCLVIFYYQTDYVQSVDSSVVPIPSFNFVNFMRRFQPKNIQSVSILPINNAHIETNVGAKMDDTDVVVNMFDGIANRILDDIHLQPMNYRVDVCNPICMFDTGDIA